VSVDATRAVRGAIIGACREVRRMARCAITAAVSMAVAICSRQKFRLNRSIFPLNLKSQQRLASRRK
jgi:hypothetical protein